MRAYKYVSSGWLLGFALGIMIFFCATVIPVLVACNRGL